MATVLLADANDGRRGNLKDELRGLRCRVFEARPEDLPDAVHRYRPAVTVIGLSAGDGAAALARIRQARGRERRGCVILLASGGSEDFAVAAFRAGVSDYFRDPVSCGEVVDRITRALGAASEEAAVPTLIGTSEAMRAVRERLGRVAAQEATVLLTGETGTGKELAAEHLHAGSTRSRQPFVPINCAAIPDTLLESELFGYDRGAFTGAIAARPGLLQQAQGGTVFLDEIGEMSPVGQAKVLRALESREVVPVGGRTPMRLDVRIVAATNLDLEQAVSAGRFRSDLYFRLNVVRIHLPPLRERSSDIASLLAHYLDHFVRRTGRSSAGFTGEAVARLERYGWPGNVRELKNLVEAVFAGASVDPIGVDELPPEFVARLPGAGESPASERAHLLAALTDARWNMSRAARHLHCSRMTLYRRMARLHVTRSDES